jgi:hypothetical protein
VGVARTATFCRRKLNRSQSGPQLVAHTTTTIRPRARAVRRRLMIRAGEWQLLLVGGVHRTPPGARVTTVVVAILHIVAVARCLR